MLIFLLFLTINAFAMSFEQLLQRACTVPDSSQLYFRQAARQIKTNKDKASFELYKAIYAGSMGTPDSAIAHAKKALVLYKNEKDTAKIMFTCNTLGKAYQKKGTYEHAIKVLLDGLRMAQHKNEKLWQGYFLVNIALNFHDFGDYKRGVKYASDAFRVFQTESASKPMDAVLATEYVGGMLYERMEEVFEDGVVDDMVYAATVAARERSCVLKAQLERILATETV
jgi:ATP/maltotriose-dependent transcriptional regulator MalT